MNYAALLGVIAAAAFTLPLVARLAVSLGLPRATGVAVSLLTAVLAAAIWYVKARRAAAKPRVETPAGRVKLLREPSLLSVEEENAGVQGRSEGR